MSPRHWLGSFAVATSLVLVDQLGISLRAAPATPDEITSLPIRLAASTGLSPLSKKALTVEAAAMAKVPLAGTEWIPGVDSR